MKRIINNRKFKIHRLNLRKKITKAEELFWNIVRNRKLKYKIRRQCSIGPYIVDFCCVERKLVVEIDGGYHSETVDKDTERNEYLAALGYRVIKCTNEEVEYNPAKVIRKIKDHIFLPP